MRNFLPACVLLLFIPVSYAQSGLKTPDSLAVWADHLLQIQYDDSLKLMENQRFIAELSDYLEIPENFNRPFSDLPSVSVLSDPDGKFRVFSWLVLTRDGYKPFGLIQTYTGENKLNEIIRLEDMDEEPKSLEYKTLSAEKWLGALYYDMLKVEYKKETYYLMLGFTPGDGLVQRKVIDVLDVSGNKVRFGKPVFFDENGKMQNRVVFNYSSMAKMSLRFDSKGKRVVFDHLSPSDPALKGQWQVYGPDFSYDAYTYAKGVWTLVNDVDARNEDENLGSQGIPYDLELPPDTTNLPENR